MKKRGLICLVGLFTLLASMGCVLALASVPVSDELVEIGEEAYAGDVSLTELFLPDTLEKIGPRAFADCANLTKVICLAEDVEVADDAFQGAEKVTLTCRIGSTLAAWGESKGIPVEYYDGFELVRTEDIRAVGLPISWHTEDIGHDEDVETNFHCELFKDGGKTPIVTYDCTDGKFTYTPTKQGKYQLRVTMTNAYQTTIRTDEEVDVPRYVRMGVYEQDGSKKTTDALEWQVLGVEDGKALLITRYIIKNESYFNPEWIKYKYTYWSGSFVGEHETNYWGTVASTKTLIKNITPTHVPLKDHTFGVEADLYPVHARYWLNGTFYQNTFTDEEREKILLTHNVNNSNPMYDTPGGPDTDDYVFFLSYEEVVKYMKGTEAKKVSMTTVAKAQTDRNIGRYWWLRTPGRYNTNAMLVQGTTGGISEYGNDVGHDFIGYRPCVWIAIGNGDGGEE